MIGLGARLGAVPAARLAPGEDGELDLLLRPEDCLLERDPEVVPKVRAGLRAAPTLPRACGAEERVEDVREATEAAGSALGTDGPEQVIALPALRVGQDLVRLVDLLEPDRRLGLLVDVRVPALREPAIRPLDVGVGRAALHAQDLVVVADGHRPEVYGRSGVRSDAARSTARRMTASSIGRVSLPVKVFCWLTW